MAQLRSVRKTISNNFFRKSYASTTAYIKRRPLGSFFIALGLLFVIIIIGHIANQPKAEKPIPPVPKTVQIYSIGQAPEGTFQAKIEKAGVVKIVAQTSGIVQEIDATNGSSIKKGQQILSLSSNYQGGNALGLQAQVAQAQYQNVLDSYNSQEDAINKQRNIANATYNNYVDQQNIASQSASQTNSLIGNNQTVLDTLNQELTALQNSGSSSADLASTESQINTLQGAQNTLKSSLLNLQEQTDSGKAPGVLAQNQQQLTLDQLDVQEKSLQLNKEVTNLQAQMAAVNADTMLPASPFDGVVERVFVHPGDQVSPGTELAIVSADESSSQSIAVVDVPQQIAQNVSRMETSTFAIGTKTYQLKPYYISTEATNGLLYSIFYTLPDDAANNVTDGQYINISIPIGTANSGATVPFIPIDAVYQTQDSNYLLVDENGIAVSRKVTLGNVYGNFIEITNGLNLGDEIILNRNIVAGDKITTN